MSALLPKADIDRKGHNVRFVPKADMTRIGERCGRYRRRERNADLGLEQFFVRGGRCPHDLSIAGRNLGGTSGRRR